MRIALITPWDYKCGISVYAEHVTGHLRRLGHEVLIFAHHGDERDRRFEASEEGVKRCWEQDQDFFHLLQCVEAAGPLDGVNVQHEMYYCSQPHLWNQLVHGLRRQGQRVVVTYHSVPFAPHPITDHPEVDGIIVANPQAAESLVRRGWPPERVWFVEHGARPPAPPPEAATRRSLVTFGFLTGTKGYREVVQALPRLVERYPDVHLTILGSLAWRLQTYQFEYYYCELRREIIALGLADRVTLWTGFPPEAVLQETIARHDVSILYYTPTFPSFAASACLRTAFSAARPVIVSECHHFDGPPDTEAAMIRVGSVPQMGEAIGRLFDDADYYREMARRARQCALRRPHAAVAADYVRVFEAVAGGARREPPRGSEPGLARPVLGVALLTAGEPERLRRALQSISETSEGMPVIVVDSREQSEAGALMRDEFASVPYVRLAGGEPLQALATAATVMNVRYLQLLEDRQVLLPGWQEDLLAAVRSGVGVVTCAAVHNGAVGGLEVRREVESLSQLCVGREALWTVTAAEFHPGAAAWRKEAARPPAGPGPELLARLREGGYTVHPLNRALVAEG